MSQTQAPAASSARWRLGARSALDISDILMIDIDNLIRLLDFIEAIEEELNKKAIRNYLPMQEGDVPATWADADLLFRLTKFKPNTSYKQGVKNFVNWYRDYFSV